MASTVSVNDKTVVTKKSEGKGLAFPDTCLTPMGPAMVPVPYNNLAESKTLTKASLTVKADGLPMAVQGSFFAMSTGDEAGVGGNVTTGVIQGKAEFTRYSMDVKVEGKGVVRQMDSMVQNCGSGGTTPAKLNQPPAAKASKGKEEKSVFKIVVKDKKGKAIAGIKFKAKFADGTMKTGVTKAGPVTLKNVPEGECKVTFEKLKTDIISLDE